MVAAPTQLDFDNWAAWVTIDQQRVELYTIKEDRESRKVSCFIEAESGKTFEVHVRDDRSLLSYTDFCATLKVDGASMRSFVLEKRRPCLALPLGDQGRVVHYTGRPESYISEQPFVFSKPQTTDDADEATTSESIVKNLGTIQLSLRRGAKGEPTQTAFTPHYDPVLHEKSKKAVSHNTALGASKPTKLMNYSKFNYSDPIDSPFWTFEFRYMSRDLLEIRGHVEPVEEAAASMSPPPAANVGAPLAIPKPDPDAAPNTGARNRKRPASNLITLSDSSDDEGPAEGEDSKAEVARLKARLAKLEKGLKVKKEGEGAGVMASGSGSSRRKFNPDEVLILD